MTHVAFQGRRDVPGAVELEVDYVVVGSGAGGATAAVTLAGRAAKGRECVGLPAPG